MWVKRVNIDKVSLEETEGRLLKVEGNRGYLVEGIMTFSDELFKLGMGVKEVDMCKELTVEVFRSNVMDDKLRYNLLYNKHKV